MTNGKTCCSGSCCVGGMIAKILAIVGAVNWGLVGLGNLSGNDWNLVELTLGGMPMLRDIVYVLVGLSGVVLIICWVRKCSCHGGVCAHEEKK